MQNTLIIITNAQSLLISASVTHKPPSAVFMLSKAELQRDKTAEWTQLHDQQKSNMSENIMTSHLPQSQKTERNEPKSKSWVVNDQLWHTCGVRTCTWQAHRVDTPFKNFSLCSCSFSSDEHWVEDFCFTWSSCKTRKWRRCKPSKQNDLKRT